MIADPVYGKVGLEAPAKSAISCAVAFSVCPP